jgi:5'-methylthioadenosine phosphorylase
VIGGSGFYDFLANPQKKEISTPFSSDPVIVYQQDIEGKTLYFLPRHGGKHSIPPHMINFKANIYALHSLGINRVLATSAVGSVSHSFKPGDYVILDQFIDFVRPLTYFDGNFSIEFPNGRTLAGVIHIDMTDPYCTELRKIIWEVIKDLSGTHEKGTYLTSMGPRFETPAEIKASQALGGEVVGMTNSSEAILCRELGICYSTIAVITNYAAGLQEQVNHQEVLDIFNSRSSQLKDIFHDIISRLPELRSCNCANHISEE